MNKCLNVIGIMLVLLFFSYCGKKEAPQIEVPDNNAHMALAKIDSLMWRRPDSAFMLLQEFVVSPEAEELDTFEGHYCQMLISELLYKNDCEQTNRPALQQAVAYFDSLVRLAPPFKGAGGIKKDLNPNPNLAFLTARAHYINGVGYYENDSIVKACAEYLKALEVMEERFAEKDLVEKKAQFMTYIYNRLGDMFSDQYMMESSIVCYEKALVYCKIEPTSPQGVSNIYTRLGVQYDKLGNKDKMRDSYELAIKEMPNTDNLGYRDLVVSKALGDYQLGLGVERSLNAIRQILAEADDDSEKLSRFLVIGAIFAEESLYDSALFYLEPIFEIKENITAKITAAECLQTIYDSIGDTEKLDKCMLYLASKKKSEAQNKALVSQLDDLFKSYTNQKLEKKAEKARKKSIKKTIEIIVPIAIAIASTILIIAKLRSKRLLEEQQVDADRKLGESEQQHKEELRQRQAEAEKMLEDKENHHQQEMEAKEAQARKELEERDKQHTEAIEAERQTHRMEQAAISGRLKRSNQEVRELKEQIKHLDDLAAKTETATSFNEEPICRLIMERVHDGQFKSKIDCDIYKSYALDKQQLLDLRMAADRHFYQFTLRLRKAYPKLTSIDIDYCCLYLLNLTYADVSALMQRAYNTVVERDSKIQKIIGSEKPLPVILMDIARNSSSN